MQAMRRCHLLVGSLLVNSGLNITSRPTTVATAMIPPDNAVRPAAPGVFTPQTGTSAALALQILSNQLKQVGFSLPNQQVTRQPPPPLPKTTNFNIRVINPLRKKDFDTYVLRDLAKEDICTPVKLKEEIYKQLGPELVSSDLQFAVGYIKGSSKITANSSADIADIWTLSDKGSTMTLWCEKNIRTATDSSDDDLPIQSDTTFQPKRKKQRKVSKLEERAERVQGVVDTLREQHGSKFTTLQYRLWAEVIDAGTHKSLEEPPHLPAFIGREKRSTPIAGLTNAVAEMAKVMVSQNAWCSGQATSTVCSAGVSPAKIANLRSSYLQQMRDLHSLLEAGALTNQEFLEQKTPILEQLKSLKPV